jgi:hypothetical protein
MTGTMGDTRARLRHVYWIVGAPNSETMLETFHWFQGELFGLMVEELLRYP